MEMKEQDTEKTGEIKETGSVDLDGDAPAGHRIKLITIIGEIEGHEAVSGNTKATKYEHLLPMLAQIEDSPQVDGLLILLNTLGGDVEALAVSADYSYIVPSGTMIIHPVRSSGMCIGVMQSFRNMERTQDRITGFLSRHSRMSRERIEELMLNSTQLVKDVGTLLEGEEAVREGLIDEVGGLSDALGKLHEMIENCRKGQEKP